VQNVTQIALIAFLHSAAKKFCTFVDRKTTVRSHCATDVQLMHYSIRRPTVPSFRILCGPFVKEQGSIFTISINFKISYAFQVSHYFASQCDWLHFYNQCHSHMDNRTKLIMFNSCNTGRNHCRMTAAATVAVVTDHHDDCIA